MEEGPDLQPVQAAASARARVSGLEVSGDLFGATHHFTRAQHQVGVRVPAVERGADLRPVGHDRDRAEFRSGYAERPTAETNRYSTLLTAL